MTGEIFRQDPYVFQFEADIVRVDGDEVVLDSTAFYPGGGGQVCDTGMLRDFEVKGVMRRNDEIVHIVPGNRFKVGEKVWGSVDWDRRYDLMMGHTAEHLLFGSLRRSAPEVGIVKIFISPESKYVIIDRDVTWDVIRDAVSLVNKAISDNLTVRRVIMDRDDPDMANVRVDLDKVKGSEISVTEIGDVDSAACSGIHVMETGEIGAVFVDRKVSAGKDGTAVHFKIGRDAVNCSMGLANTCLQVSEALESKPEDIVRAAANMKDELEVARQGIGIAVSGSVNGIVPETVNGVDVYSAVLPAADGRVFTDASEGFRNRGAVSVLIASGRQLTVYIASGDGRVDSGAVLKAVLPSFSGRGGGKAGYAQGGTPDTADADRLLSALVGEVKRSLS